MADSSRSSVVSSSACSGSVMWAQYLDSPGHLSLVQKPIPVPHPREVLLKVSHCALCRTDAKIWKEGHRDLQIPRILGHEFCGLDVSTGERFLAWPGTSCGRCRFCRMGAENLCSEMRILGFHLDGGLAEYAAVPQDSLIPLPSPLAGRLACLAEPLGCALNALEQVHLARGLSILIYGGGPVGLLMALAAKAREATPFIVESNRSKFQLSEVFRTLTKLEAGQTAPMMGEFDVAINAAPAPEILLEGLPKLRSGGTFCLFSGLTGLIPKAAAVLNELHYRQLRLVGAYGCTRRQMEEALQILLDHQAAASLLIQSRISLAEVPAALSRILSGDALKFVVDLDPE